MPLMPPEPTCTGWAWLCPTCNRIHEAYLTRFGALLSQLVHRYRAHAKDHDHA